MLLMEHGMGKGMMGGEMGMNMMGRVPGGMNMMGRQSDDEDNSNDQ